jgi:hypothetical protein
VELHLAQITKTGHVVDVYDFRHIIAMMTFTRVYRVYYKETKACRKVRKVIKTTHERLGVNLGQTEQALQMAMLQHQSKRI